MARGLRQPTCPTSLSAFSRGKTRSTDLGVGWGWGSILPSNWCWHMEDTSRWSPWRDTVRPSACRCPCCRAQTRTRPERPPPAPGERWRRPPRVACLTIQADDEGRQSCRGVEERYSSPMRGRIRPASAKPFLGAFWLPLYGKLAVGTPKRRPLGLARSLPRRGESLPFGFPPGSARGIGKGQVRRCCVVQRCVVRPACPGFFRRLGEKEERKHDGTSSL